MQKIKRIKLQLVFVVLSLCLGTVSAQNKVRIYGRVSDDIGQAISLVSISVKNSIRGTTTDTNGNYEFSNGKQDSLDLVFSCLGYETKSITIPCNADYHLSLTLSALTHQIEAVYVEEDLIAGQRMVRLNPKLTNSLPSASGNAVEDLVSTMTGVSSTNEMSSQYSVRGGNFDENLVYVNGIEVYRPLLIRSGQQEGLSFINPDLVSNISFSSGGFDAEYGDKMSSVLDIAYRRPTDFAATVSAGLLGASIHLEDASKNGKFTHLHGLRYKSATYLLNTLETDAEYDPSFVDYQTLLTYKINNNLSLSFLGNLSYNQYNFIPETRETRFGTNKNAKMLTVFFDGWENDAFRSLTTATTLNYTPSAVSNYRLTLSSFATNEQERYDILGEYYIDDIDVSSQSRSDTTRGIGVGGYQEHARNDLQVYVNSFNLRGTHLLGSHLLRWGADLQLEHIKDDLTEWELRDSVGFSQPYNSTSLKVDSYFRTINDFSSVRLKGYLQDSYTADKISLTYGLRYSYWSFSDELVLSPRVSMVYSPDDARFFRIALGRYCQTPFYKEIRNREGELNKNIKSQKSLHFVLGYDYVFKLWERPFKYTFETYYKHLTDLIPYDVDNVRLAYYGKNMSQGYAMGAESRLYGEFVPGVDSWVGLTVMSTKEKLDGTDQWVPRPTDQRYNFTIFFQDYWPGNPNYKTHLKLIFGGGLPFGPPDGDKSKMVFRSSPYQRVDWGISRLVASNEMNKKVVKNLWIDFEVLNLFGIKNANSNFWVTDVDGQQFAVPNYLTGRRFNLKLTAKF